MPPRPQRTACASASRPSEEQSQQRPAGRTAAALIFSTEGPLGAYGTLGTVHDQIEALGLENVFADQKEAYFEVTSESLLKRDPDVLILLSQKIGETPAQVRKALLSRKELRKLEAIETMTSSCCSTGRRRAARSPSQGSRTWPSSWPRSDDLRNRRVVRLRRRVGAGRGGADRPPRPDRRADRPQRQRQDDAAAGPLRGGRRAPGSSA